MMQNFDQIYRNTVLGVSGNRNIEQLVRTKGWAVAQRFVAGDTLEEAVKAVDDLESIGVHGILDLLGEMVTSEAQADGFTENILSIFDALERKGYPIYVSLKLSQIGQDITLGSGENLGMVNARRILARAKQLGGFVRLDMEDHPRVDATLEQFRILHGEFGNTVGTVLQSYLYRTEMDLFELSDLRPNLRMVKGAYLEPAHVAFQNKVEVDAQYRKLVFKMLERGQYVCVATHDTSIIEDVKIYIEKHGISRDRFEFQMLYGIRRDLQQRLA